MQKPDKTKELERWRMILGGGNADGTGYQLSSELSEVDSALSSLYDFERNNKSFNYGNEQKGKGGMEGSNPGVARWLGDIRKYFPVSIVNVMQNDAMKHPELKKKMIFEPEILEKTEADVHLVATLMELGKLIPSKTKDTARRVVQKVVDELIAKLEQKTIAALTGALNKSSRNKHPRHNEINWNATIQKNLKHYQPEYKTIIPEVRIGYGRKSRLDDQGSPSYDANNASTFAKNGIPVFACTPDLFPDLMATAIRKQDISLWAAKEDVIIKK